MNSSKKESYIVSHKSYQEETTFQRNSNKPEIEDLSSIGKNKNISKRSVTIQSIKITDRPSNRYKNDITEKFLYNLAQIKETSKYNMTNSEGKTASLNNVLNGSLDLPTIHDVMKVKQRSVLFNVCYALVLASGGFFFAFYEQVFCSIGYNNPYQDFEYDDPKSFKEIEGFVQFTNIIFSLGCAFGLISSGILINIIGRVKTIIYNEIFIMLIFAGYQIRSGVTVFLVHACAGIASGVMLHTCIIVNIELVPKAVNPISGIFFVLFYCINMTINWIYMYYSEKWFFINENPPVFKQYWRLWIILPLVFQLPRLIFFMIYNFDTPQYYLLKYNESQDFDVATRNLNENKESEEFKQRNLNEPSEYVSMSSTSSNTACLNLTPPQKSVKQYLKGFEKSAEVLSVFYQEEEIGFVHMFILQDYNFKSPYLMGNRDGNVFCKHYLIRILSAVLIACIRELTDPKYLKEMLNFSIIAQNFNNSDDPKRFSS